MISYSVEHTHFSLKNLFLSGRYAKNFLVPNAIKCSPETKNHLFNEVVLNEYRTNETKPDKMQEKSL